MIKPESRWFVIMLASLNAMTALAVDTSLPAMPAIVRDLNTTPDRVQLVLSLFLIGYAFGQILWGPLSDRFGRKPILLAGLAIYTICGLACTLSPSIWPLVFFRFVQAIGAAVGPSLSRAVVRDYHGGPRAAHMLSTVTIAMSVALVVAPILGGFLAAYAGWRGIFMFLTIFGAILTLVIWRGFSESLQVPDLQASRLSRLLANIIAFFGNRVCLAYAVINGCVQGGLLAYISAAPFVMIEVFGVSPRYFGFYFATAALGLMGGATLNRRLVRRKSSEWLLRRGLFVQAGASLCLLAIAASAWGGPALFMVPVVVFAFAQGLVMSNAIAGAMEPLPYMAGMAAALLGAVQMASGGLAGYIVNALYNHTALPIGVVMALLSCAALAAYHLMLYRGPKSP